MPPFLHIDPCEHSVVYYDKEFQPAELADLIDAGYTTRGWYFWDETAAHCFGPFPTQGAASTALNLYIGLRTP